MGSARTFYDKAAANLRCSRILLEYGEGEEGQIAAAAFHLQQAAELALKHLLRQNGVDYPQTQNIDQLIRLGRDAGVQLYLTEYLEDHAEMLYRWEAQWESILDYTIEVGAVEWALSEIEDYLVDVAAQETAAIAALEAGSYE